MHILTQTRILWITALSVLAGCAAQYDGSATVPIDPVDGTFLTGDKVDGFGFDEKSIQAYLVLRACNTLSYEQLVGDVGLHPDAARALVEHRMGPDRSPGTADDDPFDTLGELDAVPHFGLIAVTQIVSYMTAAHISGGTYDSGDPGVVAVTALDHEGRVKGLCSGTLIAPEVVLTAAHCLQAGHAFDVYFGSMLFQEGADPARRGHVAVTARVTHPAWDAAEMVNDVALLALAQPAPAVPVPLQRESVPAEWAGRDVRLVGFGVSDGSVRAGAGTKRELGTALDSVQDQLLLVAQTNGQGSCFGDSGGPLLLMTDGVERVAGVTSFGDALCSSMTVYARADRYLDFIDSFVEAHGGWERCEPRALTTSASGIRIMREAGPFLIFSDGGTVWRMAKEGGAPAVLAHGFGGRGVQIEVAGSSVYLLGEDSNYLVRVPIDGGPQEQLGPADAFTVDERFRYVVAMTDDYDPSLGTTTTRLRATRTAHDGTGRIVLAQAAPTNPPRIGDPIFAHDGILVLQRDNALWEINASGAQTELDSYGERFAPRDVASNEAQIFYSSWGGISAIDKVSRARTRLLNAEVNSIAVEGAYIFFTQWNDGTISRLPVAGGSPQLVASGQRYASDVVVDMLGVYWTAGTKIMRVPRGACGL